MKKEQKPKNQLIILFDGYCHLCNGTVDILLKIDRNDDFLFASLQSEYGKLIQVKHPNIAKVDSILVLENDVVYSKSDAVLNIIQKLPWYFKWLYVFKILPKSLRDGAYDIIAANRHYILGKRETCRMPTTTERKKFIE